MHQIDPQELRTTSVLNSCIAPGYSHMELLDVLQRKVRGHGGYLDHLYTYIDGKSSLDWAALTQQIDYFQFIDGQGFPFTWAAKNVYAKWKKMGYSNVDHVEVIALGSGDALRETRMVEALVEAHPSLQHLDFSLMDISPTLLDWGHERACRILKHEPRVHTVSVRGNFSDLSMYSELYFSRGQMNRPRLILMFGGTFCNLDNELSFIKNSLGSFPAGTLFLVDFCSGFAPAELPAEVLKKEPYLSKNISSKWYKGLERFIVGPFKRYRELLSSQLHFEPALDNRTTVIPGSYAVELNVEVEDADGIKHVFGTHRIKRYDGKQLADAIESMGWKTIAGQHFTPTWQTYLFCKQ